MKNIPFIITVCSLYSNENILKVAVGDLSLEERVQWAHDLPYDTVKDARQKGEKI